MKIPPEKREVSRRDFLLRLARDLMHISIAPLSISILGKSLLKIGLINIRPLRQEIGETERGPGIKERRFGFVIDTSSCIGCGICVRSCKIENRIPLHSPYSRTWVERYRITRGGEVLIDSPMGGIDGFGPIREGEGKGRVIKSFFVPKLCNQCENPPCVQVCPVGASYRTEEGVVLIDRGRCIGCGYCVQVCPYGARFIDHEAGIADKCTWCYHRIMKGLLPVCVQVCPARARIFGDLEKPEEMVSRILIKERVFVLKGELGTKPVVYYIGESLNVV